MNEMKFSEAIFLGIIQGMTEFIPISSSGHLVFGQELLGIKQPGNVFEILVHLGTLLSVIVVFFAEIRSIIFSLNKKKTQNFIIFILLGTLPSAIIGLGMKDFFYFLFDNITVVSVSLIFTGIILFISSFAKKMDKELSILSSILIGLAQSLAIIPGISRSGMTISAALFLGLSPKDAAKFSFLLAIPAISGAGLLMTINMEYYAYSLPFSIAISAFISSFIIGVIALKWLLGWLEQGKFHYFGIYCFVVGFVTLVI